MSEESTGNVANTIASVLDCLQRVDRGSAKGDAPWRVVSYARDFDYLWDIGASAPAGLPAWIPQEGKELTLVVVWDSLPPKGSSSLVDTQRYLTPFDWAVGLSLEIADAIKKGVIQDAPRLRIFVVDLISDTLPEAGSVRFFRLLPRRELRAMPWIRIITLTGGTSADWTYANLLWNVVASKGESRLAFMKNAMTECYDEDIAMLGRIWTSGLTQAAEPGDHHALANLVGPLLLRQGIASDSHEQALQRLLRQVGLVASQLQKRESNDTWLSWVNWKGSPFHEILNEMKESLPLHFLLLDDAAFRHHWAEVLSQTLGVPYIHPKDEDGLQLIGQGSVGSNPMNVLKLFAFASPEIWLADLIPSDPQAKENEKEAKAESKQPSSMWCDKRFRLTMPGGDRLDLLFLDLRLFQGRSIAAEAGFYERLLPLARQFCVEKEGSDQVVGRTQPLPWPGISKKELEAIESWIEKCKGSATKAREGNDYDLVLTLLPRILALLDLGLPIVLFSSTGRREIVKLLKPYESIIIDFEKPRLTALADSGLVEGVRTNFEIALGRAFPFIPARRMCAALCERYPEAQCEATSAEDSAKEDPWRITLTLDEHQEHGDALDPLVVGGILLICPPAVDPERFDSLVKKIPELRYQSRDERVKAERKRDRDIIAEAIFKDLPTGASICVVTVTGQPEQRVAKAGQDDEWHDERVGDNLHRQLLRCVVELAVYGVARRIIPEGESASFNVLGATRNLKPKGKTSQERDKYEQSFRKRWGIDSEYVNAANTRLWNAHEELERLLTSCAGLPESTRDLVEQVQLMMEELSQIDPPLRNALKELPAFFLDRASAPDIQTQTALNCAWLMVNELKRSSRARPPRGVLFFGPAAVRPLVEEIMREYFGSTFDPDAGIVRGFNINNLDSEFGQGTWGLHLYADSVLADEGNCGTSLKKLLDQGCQEVYSIADEKEPQPLLALLETQRLYLHRAFPEAIDRGGRVWTRRPATQGSFRVMEAVGSDLAFAARRLNGADFIRLSVLLRLPEAQPKQRLHYGTVIDISLADLTVVIGDDSGVNYTAERAACTTNFFGLRKGNRVSFLPRVGGALEKAACDVRRVDGVNAGAANLQVKTP